MLVALAWAGGDAALVSAGCTLCHTLTGADAAPAPPRTESCTGCHAWIREVSANPASRAAALQVFPDWTRYERNLHTYLQVPSLDAAAARLSPPWVESWLADPHDLRPGLEEAMIRTSLAPGDRAAVSAWFRERVVAVAATPAPSQDRVAAGRELYLQRGCGACHSLGAMVASPGIPGAPDLQHARRLSADMLVAWIVDPSAVSPAATMPRLGLTVDEATAVRDFLLLAAPPAPPASPATSPRLALAADSLASDPPTWDVVNRRVFARICAHCHMDPAQNEGRAGPGNAGGFGFAPTGIELQTYEGVVAHRDRILASLARKELETARDAVAPGQSPAVGRPERPGMPLGLPALDPADLALVRQWFALGAPR